MPASQSTSINLLLPVLPETQNPELFSELVRVYNAINLLANGIDTYTNAGTVTQTVSDVEDKNTILTAQLIKNNKQLKILNTALSGVIDISSSYFELRKAYYKYLLKRLEVLGDTKLDGHLDVYMKTKCHADLEVIGSTNLDADLTVANTLTVTGGGGFNGATPQVRIPTSSGGSAPPSGAGTLAGAYDTAANRDAAIAAINANSSAIDSINNLLHDWGFRT